MLVPPTSVAHLALRPITTDPSDSATKALLKILGISALVPADDDFFDVRELSAMTQFLKKPVIQILSSQDPVLVEGQA